MEIDKKDIKEFAEFEETVPTATHNLITDKGRFSVSALYNAVADYVRELFADSVATAVGDICRRLRFERCGVCGFCFLAG